MPGIPAPLGLSSCLQVVGQRRAPETYSPAREMPGRGAHQGLRGPGIGRLEPAESPGTKEEAEAQERRGGQPVRWIRGWRLRGQRPAAGRHSRARTELLDSQPHWCSGNCRKALQSCWEWESRTERALSPAVMLGPQHHSGTKDVDTDTPAPSHSPAATGSSEPDGAGCF